MIESKDNEKLKLVRKLRERKHRERQGLFVTEGEDLLEAGLATGAKPKFVLAVPGARSSLPAPTETRSTYATYSAGNDDHASGSAGKDDHSSAGAGNDGHASESAGRDDRSSGGAGKDDRTWGGVGGGAAGGLDWFEVEPGLLDSVSVLGSGTRAIAVWSRTDSAGPTAPCVYLGAVGDPGNVGTIVRTAHALLDATVALGPGCADAYGPKATRASMGSLFARPPANVPGVEATPGPRVALVAHGGEGLEALAGAATLCLGSERDGLPDRVIDACERSVTIPLAGTAESLNVAAAAAIACERLAATGGARLSSPAMSREAPDA